MVGDLRSPGGWETSYALRGALTKMDRALGRVFGCGASPSTAISADSGFSPDLEDLTVVMLPVFSFAAHIVSS